VKIRNAVLWQTKLVVRVNSIYRFYIGYIEMYSNKFYNVYQKNIHSQNGEDGIVEELLKRLNIESGYVCEFGAWDGIHFIKYF